MQGKYLWVDNVEVDQGEECKEIDDDMITEKTRIIKSLNELRSQLTENMVESTNYSQSIDPGMFDKLPSSLVKFCLPFPLPPPFELNSQFVCETASRLLFLSVHWARNIYVFQTLPHSTKVSLLKSSWADLFILSLAQCKDQISFPAVLTAAASHLQTCLGQDSLSLNRTKQLVNTLTKIKNIVNRLDELGLDPEEFAYLRLCSLFGPGEINFKLIYFKHSISRSKF